MDTVEQLQFEIDALQSSPPGPSTSTTWAPPVQPRQAAFTTTKVPKFSGVTSWEQHKQVFKCIGLARALTDHYGLSGRLADYRRQFEKTGRGRTGSTRPYSR